MDVTNLDQVNAWLSATRPEIVINCAAYTKVDQAEKEPEACLLANATGVQHLAKVCSDLNITLCQISTDYVFGGDPNRTTPFRESDDVAPQSVYAKSKLLGEGYASQVDKHYIIRTCGLYCSQPANNFVNTIARLAHERETLRVVNDQWCCPTFVPDLVQALAFLLETRQYGIYHIVNSGQTTWWHLAQEIVEAIGSKAQVVPVSTLEYGSAASRPAYSVLDISKYEQLGGPAMRTISSALRVALRSQ